MPRLSLLAALAVFFIASLTAPAKAAHVCQAYDVIGARMVKLNPGAQPLELNKKQREIFLAAFNASPPASTYKPARVIIWRKAGSKSGFVMFVNESDCVTQAVEMQLKFIIGWLKGEVQKPDASAPGQPRQGDGQDI